MRKFRGRFAIIKNTGIFLIFQHISAVSITFTLLITFTKDLRMLVSLKITIFFNLIEYFNWSFRIYLNISSFLFFFPLIFINEHVHKHYYFLLHFITLHINLSIRLNYSMRCLIYLLHLITKSNCKMKLIQIFNTYFNCLILD